MFQDNLQKTRDAYAQTMTGVIKSDTPSESLKGVAFGNIPAPMWTMFFGGFVGSMIKSMMKKMVLVGFTENHLYVVQITLTGTVKSYEKYAYSDLKLEKAGDSFLGTDAKVKLNNGKSIKFELSNVGSDKDIKNLFTQYIA
jgi:hypothetical protein